jgi:hypothetical protein
MPRGKKTCPSCNALVGARVGLCDCGHKFSPAKKKKPKPFFSARKNFIKRMLGESKALDWRMEMHTVTKVFEQFVDCEKDLEFLEKVKPPFVFKNTIKFFLTKEGREYLTKKRKEFYYKPPDKDKYLDTKEKVGQDILENKKKTLKDFLNE